MTDGAQAKNVASTGPPAQAQQTRSDEAQSICSRPAAPGAAATAKPIKVLIVEDSKIIRERLAAMVLELGTVIVVGQAEDGFNAQTLFRQHLPDAIILDLQLPGINGMDLLEQFKRERPGAVVMVLTTYVFKEFRQRCAALGADYFFDKSLEFERINEVLIGLQTGDRSKFAAEQSE